MGYWYATQFRLRLIHLRAMSRIMEMLISEVRFSKATLPECCYKIADKVEEPYKQGFSEIYRIMKQNTGKRFAEIYQEQMTICLKEVPVHKKEKELFTTFFAADGFEDSSMQIRSIEQYNEELKQMIQVLEKDTSEKSKVALGLGAMSGLLLIIILL